MSDAEKPVIDEMHPVLRAIMNAPLGEPMTEAERAAVSGEFECEEERAQVEEARRTGIWIPGEVVTAMIEARRLAEG